MADARLQDATASELSCGGVGGGVRDATAVVGTTASFATAGTGATAASTQESAQSSGEVLAAPPATQAKGSVIGRFTVTNANHAAAGASITSASPAIAAASPTAPAVVPQTAGIVQTNQTAASSTASASPAVAATPLAAIAAVPQTAGIVQDASPGASSTVADSVGASASGVGAGWSPAARSFAGGGGGSCSSGSRAPEMANRVQRNGRFTIFPSNSTPSVNDDEATDFDSTTPDSVSLCNERPDGSTGLGLRDVHTFLEMKHKEIGSLFERMRAQIVQVMAGQGSSGAPSASAAAVCAQVGVGNSQTASTAVLAQLGRSMPGRTLPVGTSVGVGSAAPDTGVLGSGRGSEIDEAIKLWENLGQPIQRATKKNRVLEEENKRLKSLISLKEKELHDLQHRLKLQGVALDCIGNAAPGVGPCCSETTNTGTSTPTTGSNITAGTAPIGHATGCVTQVGASPVAAGETMMRHHSGGDRGNTSVTMSTTGGMGLATQTQTLPATQAQSVSDSLTVSPASSADPATVFVAGGDMARSNSIDMGHQPSFGPSGSGIPQGIQAGPLRSGVSPLSAAEPKPSMVQRRAPVASPQGAELETVALPSLRRAVSMTDAASEVTFSPLPTPHFGLGTNAATLAALSGLAAHSSAPAVPCMTSATPVDLYTEFTFTGQSLAAAAAAPATTEPDPEPDGAVASIRMLQSAIVDHIQQTAVAPETNIASISSQAAGVVATQPPLPVTGLAPVLAPGLVASAGATQPLADFGLPAQSSSLTGAAASVSSSVQHSVVARNAQQPAAAPMTCNAAGPSPVVGVAATQPSAHAAALGMAVAPGIPATALGAVAGHMSAQSTSALGIPAVAAGATSVQMSAPTVVPTSMVANYPSQNAAPASAVTVLSDLLGIVETPKPAATASTVPPVGPGQLPANIGTSEQANTVPASSTLAAPASCVPPVGPGQLPTKVGTGVQGNTVPASSTSVAPASNVPLAGPFPANIGTGAQAKAVTASSTSVAPASTVPPAGPFPANIGTGAQANAVPASSTLVTPASSVPPAGPFPANIGTSVQANAVPASSTLAAPACTVVPVGQGQSSANVGTVVQAAPPCSAPAMGPGQPPVNVGTGIQANTVPASATVALGAQAGMVPASATVVPAAGATTLAAAPPCSVQPFSPVQSPVNVGTGVQANVAPASATVAPVAAGTPPTAASSSSIPPTGPSRSAANVGTDVMANPALTNAAVASVAAATTSGAAAVGTHAVHFASGGLAVPQTIARPRSFPEALATLATAHCDAGASVDVSAQVPLPTVKTCPLICNSEVFSQTALPEAGIGAPATGANLTPRTGTHATAPSATAHASVSAQTSPSVTPAAPLPGSMMATQGGAPTASAPMFLGASHAAQLTSSQAQPLVPGATPGRALPTTSPCVSQAPVGAPGIVRPSEPPASPATSSRSENASPQRVKHTLSAPHLVTSGASQWLAGSPPRTGSSTASPQQSAIPAEAALEGALRQAASSLVAETNEKKKQQPEQKPQQKPPEHFQPLQHSNSLPQLGEPNVGGIWNSWPARGMSGSVIPVPGV